MKLLFIFSIAFASSAQASICQKVRARIGDAKSFHYHSQNAETAVEVKMTKVGETRGTVNYSANYGGRSVTLTMKSFGPLCLMKTKDELAFPQGRTLALSIPNEKGECWVYAARISRIVPVEFEKEFIAGGFCVSPLSMDPDTSWKGTSAMTPIAAPVTP